MEDRPIIRLNEEIIGKIAAGEVVESPASAIKELIENSLDAGASCVTIEIRDGGISYLRVTDNGRGIPAKDVRLAFERHATSKIRKSEDLFDLRTLGFRGEALASIAAVSKLTLTTRHAMEDSGTRAVNEGGVIKSLSEAASPQGTTIVARELFYNTPVRLKFLKKPVTEASRVADVVAKLILARPDISFRLIHNNKQIYASSGNGDLRSAAFALYGRETANALIGVHSEGSVAVDGLIGVGALARSNRARQTFIVNGRTIRSPLLTQALEDGCRERVTIGHYPVCVLNVQMPVSMVDVNVHPNKLEVRFSDENLIYQNVKGAVMDCFAASPLEGAPSVSFGISEKRKTDSIVQLIDTQTQTGIDQAKRENAAVHQQQENASIHVIETDPLVGKADQKINSRPEEAVRPSAKQHEAFSSFVSEYFGRAMLRESAIPARKSEPAILEQNKPDQSASATSELHEERISIPAEGRAEVFQSNIPEQFKQEPIQQQMIEDTVGKQPGILDGYSMIGVAFDTYIMLQNDKQIIFIDQHAAHERILYEKLMRDIDNGSGSQMLMVSQVVHVTPQDRAKIEMYEQEIRQAGFDIEPFGEDAYQIRAVPNVLGVPQTKTAFLDMVDHLGELRILGTQHKRRDAILQMACKKAIKGGERLSMEEITPLLKDMMTTGAPPTCPHGRPLVVVLTRSELEKKFKRINH